MFFRRTPLKEPTFDERLDALRQAGFRIDPETPGSVRVSKDNCAAIVTGIPGRPPHIDCAGWVVAGRIALLVDGGFQKFWSVEGRRKAPALASQLTALHNFEEDLREALGIESLYNTSLGTTNDLHVYDRVEGRE
ncbi:MAG: hypothetical protein ACM336_14000 [Acidobacteriota bacterium]